MSFARGERVHFDFDSGIAEKVGSDDYEASAPPSTTFIGDILERPSAANPPAAPTFKANVHGFPKHKKRVPRVSAFKQQQTTLASQANEVPKSHVSVGLNDEKRQIDVENNQRIAGMSTEEIEQERNELLSNLSPSLIQKLLSRANIDEGSNERNFNLEPPVASTTNTSEAESKPSNVKKVSFTEDTAAAEISDQQPESSNTISGTRASVEVHSNAGTQPEQASGSIHFPKPHQPPDLDPNDPAFLKDLHEKYFPNLPYDPSSLSWMAPIDPNDKRSPYHPSQTALDAFELRFDFKGNLLAPSVARELPTSQGLHHHADAPEAAGYTIPELAILSRSEVPAQRCVAFQTLGRILYRLGQGEFGIERAKQETEGPVKVANVPSQTKDHESEEGDVGNVMASGLWNCIEEGRIIETLTEEAGREKGHLTARTYAQEALWNWRRGGGRKRQAV